MSALHFLELDPNKTRLLLRTFCLRIAKTQLDNAPGKITYKELEGVAARLEESRGAWDLDTTQKWEAFLVREMQNDEVYKRTVKHQQNKLLDVVPPREPDPWRDDFRDGLQLPALASVQRSSSVALERSHYLIDMDLEDREAAKETGPAPIMHVDLDDGAEH